MRSFPQAMHSRSLIAAAFLSVASVTLVDAAIAQPAADISQALSARQPDPTVRDASTSLGRLIGTWKVVYGDVSKSGKVTHRTGQFIAGWVLDGRAIQNVWIVDPSETRTARETYTAVRYFDPKSGSWNSVFFDPEHGTIARFNGERGTDGLVSHSSDLGAVDSRWSFELVDANTLIFRDEASDDGGKSWRLRSEDHMTRQTSVISPH